MSILGLSILELGRGTLCYALVTYLIAYGFTYTFVTGIPCYLRPANQPEARDRQTDKQTALNKCPLPYGGGA